MGVDVNVPLTELRSAEGEEGTEPAGQQSIVRECSHTHRAATPAVVQFLTREVAVSLFLFNYNDNADVRQFHQGLWLKAR